MNRKGETIFLICMAIVCSIIGCSLLAIASEMVGWPMWWGFSFGIFLILCSFFIAIMLLCERGK